MCSEGGFKSPTVQPVNRYLRMRFLRKACAQKLAEAILFLRIEYVTKEHPDKKRTTRKPNPLTSSLHLHTFTSLAD